VPAKVANIRWKCPQCGKSRWMKPHEAKTRKYCSRSCAYAGHRVEHPVRPKQARQLARYGERVCPSCAQTFDAKKPAQIYCSHACNTTALTKRRRKYAVGSATCETCGTSFTPRGGHAARFCSRQCLYEGMRGAKSAYWKGGRHVRADGYVLVQSPGHPAAFGHGGYVKEHRFVMEQHLGRYLRPSETVHHRNGDRTDNRIENLELWSKHHKPGQRVEDLVAWAKEIISMYGAEIDRLKHGG